MIRMLITWWHHECGAFFMIERLTGQGQKKKTKSIKPCLPDAAVSFPFTEIYSANLLTFSAFCV